MGIRKDKWHDKFWFMDAEDLLSVAEIMIDCLKENAKETFSDEDIDKEQEAFIINYLDEENKKLKDKVDREKLEKLSNAVKALPESEKLKLYSLLIDEITHYIRKRENERKKELIEAEKIRLKELCNAKGHVYSKDWVHVVRNIVHHEKGGIRIQDGNLYPDSWTETKEHWQKTCDRCGHVEIVYSKPQDLADKEELAKIDKNMAALEQRKNKILAKNKNRNANEKEDN